MKVLTWNVNSIRTRKEQLVSLIELEDPDVVCLQETKTPNDLFPKKEIENLGYNIYLNGIPSYNGVAILSKKKAEKTNIHKFCGKNDSRHLSISLGNICIHSLYVPAGGDIPDISINEKFLHKLEFLDEMMNMFLPKKNRIDIVCGDLNVAPYENDVWSHNQLKNVISHTEIEREKLIKILNKGKFVDTIKLFISPPKNLFTWWSYRSKDFRKNNRGRRLDHIWVSDSPSIKITDVKIIDKMRALEKPSDHVPVFCKFSLA